MIPCMFLPGAGRVRDVGTLSTLSAFDLQSLSCYLLFAFWIGIPGKLRAYGSMVNVLFQAPRKHDASASNSYSLEEGY